MMLRGRGSRVTEEVGVKKAIAALILVAFLACGLAAAEIVVQPGGTLWGGTSVRLSTDLPVLNQQGLSLTWNLGDSSPPQTGLEVEHVYKDPGTYEVRCTMSSGEELTRTLQIQERRTIHVHPVSPQVGEAVQFQAQHFGHSQIRWDFGDGTIQTAGSPVTHTYANPGAVTVKAYDFNGQSTIAVEAGFTVMADIRMIEVTGGPPRAHFPLQFEARNFGAGSLQWNFGDGDSTTGGATIQHVYNNPGTYTVSVQIAGAGNPKTLVVNVAPDPRRVNADSATPGLYETVTLRAEGFSPGNLAWDFGDGETQTAGQQVTHAYSRLGQFQVSVKAAGSSEPPVSIQVQVNQDRRRIQVQPAQVKVGDTANIQATNVEANSVEWQIGDQTLSGRPKTITHRFLDPGNVPVTCRINGQAPLTTQVNVRDHRRIQYAPETVFAGAEVNLHLQNGIGPNVRWEFSDGETRNAGLKLQRPFPRVGMVEVKAFDANGDAKAPVSQRIQVLAENRSLESQYQRHFVGTEVQLEARNFKDNMVEWDFGDGTRRMGSTRMSHKYNAPGNFRVKAVDFRGRDGKSIESQIVVASEQRSIHAPQRIRAGDPVNLELKGVQGGQFQWNLGPAGRKSGIMVHNAAFPSPGRIDVQVMDNTSTYPPFSATLVVQPDNRALKAPKFALPGEEIVLNAENFDGPKVAWDFGDGKQTLQTGTQVSHSFAEKGEFRITARDQAGDSTKLFAGTVRVVELVPGFVLQGMELVFSSGKAYMVVPRKSRPPAYALRLTSSGRGILRGQWKLDDQVMGLFSMVLQDGRVAAPDPQDMPNLPALDVGMHELTVEFTNYRFSGRIPRLRYFVSSGGAILLLSPEVGSKIPASDAAKLAWKPIRQATVYEIAVSEAPFQFLEDRQIEWKAATDHDHHVLDMMIFKDAGWIYWMVRGLNDSGRVLTTSEIGSFRQR
ncbi:MAG TPA: PKD domain-containing protein [Candidatus Aminicenantes bacterium]|nr:PKD domain-containing protein [Candidatus Aminicenantes bacterium]